MTKIEESARKAKDEMHPIHPGEMLLDELKYLNISQKRFAEVLAVPFEQLQALLNGKRNIDAEFALRLERYFGSGARMWMNLQATYSLEVAERDLGKTIEHEVLPKDDEAARVEVIEAA